MAVAMPDASCLGSSSSMLAVVPMFHANSWGLAFSAPFVGAKLILPGQSSGPHPLCPLAHALGD
jgi:fatty-acyl-CoA synthase